MAELYSQHQQTRAPNQQLQPRAQRVVKAATAVTAGGSLLVLSGLTLAGTVIALTIATPLLVIFSPVLVPAVITIFLLGAGFLASRWLRRGGAECAVVDLQISDRETPAGGGSAGIGKDEAGEQGARDEG
ncbi:Oleosin [Sesamum angolense]|uniref:Oleosin n=1 Tax=Sesamum angolense TaxID=2727404 RepID=A0AAE1W1U0_9LAMI|nr:Oleosin [Sesamum angolense]